jgi:hypothetical protein
LDSGPKADEPERANILTMKQPDSKSSLSAPRRFLLLPERLGRRPAGGARIRRYQLASVGHRRAVDRADVATALMAHELSRLGRM